MRLLLASTLLFLAGCGPGLVFNQSQEMTSDQMLERASLVFVGVIQGQHFDSWPFFHLSPPGQDPSSSKYWKVLRREVRVETVLRGVESRKVIDVYEIFWTGGTTGDWNFTRDGERDLFLVRVESGRYHVVRDWWRSIFPVTTGPHSRLPLDDSHSLWERIALMNWWIRRSDEAFRIEFPHMLYLDPGNALGVWRTVKLERGLVRHPSQGVHVPACRELLTWGGWGQDECWETLSEDDRRHLSDGGYRCCSAEKILSERREIEKQGARHYWNWFRDKEERRLLTTINNRRIRNEICRFWLRAYPDDRDNGCPADRPPPATIVTANGDVPLTGDWPR